MDYVGEGLRLLGIPDGGLSARLSRYSELLLEWNAKFDLVNADNADEVAVRHVLDSLAGVGALRAELSARGTGVGPVADVGSGAGFPGIPLACAMGGTEFVLVERMTKRCEFLRTCVRELALQNVTVEENQAERLSRGRFAAATFRAFRPLDRKMLRVLLRILADGGFLAAYKARRGKITEEMDALAECPPYRVVPLSVPFLTDGDEARERNMVVIEKE